MKQIKFIQLFCIGLLLMASDSYGQANPFINVLPTNSGVVTVGGTIDIEVTIGNTGPVSSVPQAKLRPIIQVPPSVTFLPNAQQTGLPAGWSILSNDGTQLRLCNSTDPIPVNTSRTILLKVQGVSIAPPQTFSGNINFGNGTTCGAGPSVSGDLTTDNAGLSTIAVIGTPLPLILNDFAIKTDNCTSHLSWSTSSEINSEKFEIERSMKSSVKWETIGSVLAKGNSSTTSSYYFKDDNVSLGSNVVLYRLKMVDIDGSFFYSDVLNAKLICDEQSLSAFPNPVTNGKLHVDINSAHKVEAILSNVTGQIVKKLTLETGMNKIDVSELSNGVYILNATFVNGNKQNLKINIQKQ